MASTLRTQDRLDALATEVRHRRSEYLHYSRQSGELLDGEEEAEKATDRMTAARLLLAAAHERYFEEAEGERTKRCSIHGDALYVTCGECCKAWNYQPARTA